MPDYESVKGWGVSVEEIAQYNKLPVNAKKYIEKIEKFIGTKVSYVSVGERRCAMIKKKGKGR